MITKFLKIIDRLNFKQITLLLVMVFSFCFIVLIATVVRKQINTRVGSAFFEESFATKESFTPDSPPIILGVMPYLGKSGDEVVLWGKNLGLNPNNGWIKIGNTYVDKFNKWTDEEIRFDLPVSESGLLSLSNGAGVAIFNKPLTIYSQNTDTKISISFEENSITISNAPQDSVLTYWSGSSSKTDKYIEKSSDIVRIEGNYDLSWIALFSKNGRSLSFRQDPKEFQFIDW